MLPRRFQHHRPTDLASALALLAHYGEEASPIAGGTELLIALKGRVLHYEHLIDLKRIRGLAEVSQDRDNLVIGGLASHFRLAHDPLVRRTLPAYSRLSDNIANIRVRVAGTIGGNLCFAEPHADPPTLLAALNASVALARAEGERIVPIRDFIEREFTTMRADDEILTAVVIPLPRAGTSFAYASFGHLERPAVGLAAGMVPTEGGPQYRVWVGAICDRPTRLTALEGALSGVPPEALEDVLTEAARHAAGAIKARNDLYGSADYKQHLAFVLIRRTVRESAGLAPRFGRPS